jgi:hypothetical protein
MSENESLDPKVNPNPSWKVNTKERLSACDNRPGMKKLFVTVLDEQGKRMSGIRVRFDVEPSPGVAYDHPNVWGLTDDYGELAWEHLGVPTRYAIWMEDDVDSLMENIRTDLGFEYCRPPGTTLGGWRPVNSPGVYSYRFEIQRKGAGE